MTEEAEIHSFQTQDKLEDLYFEFLENFQSQKKKAKADEKNSKERQTKNFRAELRRFLAIQHFSINFCGRDISQSPLWQAWKQTSDLKFFKEVLERDKTEVRLADENGTTIIHLAVQQSELEIVYLLEELGLLVQMKDNDGHTPLLMAIKSSDACMVSILVYKEHPELNPKDITECTPLHLAVMSYKPSDLNSLSDLDSWRLGHINRTWNERENIIGCLLEHGANPNLMNKEGKTPLLLAFDLKDEKTVDQLLSSKLIPVEVDLYQRGRTALSLATECGMENIMKKLIPKADIEKEDDDNSRRTPLAWAIHTDNYSAASILLREGKKAKLDHRNPQGRTPFSLAAGFMQVGIMTLLLREGAEPHAEDGAGKTGFWWFLNARWKSRARGLPRHSKSQASGLADLIDLLDKPDLKDSTGRTWLSWAAEYGDEEVVRYFLQKQDSTLLDGQNQKEPNVCARTPAIWAAANDHWEVYSLLINETEHDLSLNYFIENFHRFEKELGTKALDMVQKMITHSSSSTDYWITERKSREKRTPLHIACIEAHDEIVEILIWAGALSNVLDRTGKTALQHALIKKHKKIVTRLLRSMSDLQYVRSVDWLELEDTRPCWVRINKRAKDDGFKHKPIFEPQWDWSLPKNKRKAFFCAQDGLWSKLPNILGVKNDTETATKNACYIHESPGDFVVTYISIHSPAQYMVSGEVHEKCRQPWGVAWVTLHEPTENIFFSKLPHHETPDGIMDGIIPKSNYHSFQLFLKHLESEWNAACLAAGEEIDSLREKQVSQGGRDPDFINSLADNARARAQIRKCLRSHIGTLRHVCDDQKFENETMGGQGQLDGSMCLIIDRVENSAIQALDGLEQVGRELLQLEIAWISKNEATSIIHLTRITFLFLPLTFVSSLFGMNVNLLETNPDWRWYLPCAGLALLLTLGLWMISRLSPQPNPIVWEKLFARLPRKKKARLDSNSQP